MNIWLCFHTCVSHVSEFVSFIPIFFLNLLSLPICKRFHSLFLWYLTSFVFVSVPLPLTFRVVEPIVSLSSRHFSSPIDVPVPLRTPWSNISNGYDSVSRTSKVRSLCLQLPLEPQPFLFLRFFLLTIISPECRSTP